MTKPVLGLLLGAACASSWWAAGIWGFNDILTVFGSILTTVFAFLFIVSETFLE
jgi:hypothetical protein